MYSGYLQFCLFVSLNWCGCCATSISPGSRSCWEKCTFSNETSCKKEEQKKKHLKFFNSEVRWPKSLAWWEKNVNSYSSFLFLLFYIHYYFLLFYFLNPPSLSSLSLSSSSISLSSLSLFFYITTESKTIRDLSLWLILEMIKFLLWAWFTAGQTKSPKTLQQKQLKISKGQ